MQAVCRSGNVAGVIQITEWRNNPDVGSMRFAHDGIVRTAELTEGDCNYQLQLHSTKTHALTTPVLQRKSVCFSCLSLKEERHSGAAVLQLLLGASVLCVACLDLYRLSSQLDATSSLCCRLCVTLSMFATSSSIFRYGR